jgi:hypothetical protein
MSTVIKMTKNSILITINFECTNIISVNIKNHRRNMIKKIGSSSVLINKLIIKRINL